MKFTQIIIDPLIPIPFLIGLSGLLLAALIVAAFLGLRGWLLRSLSAAVLVLALLQPLLFQENRRALEDIVVVVEDRSQSQTISERMRQLDEASTVLKQRIGQFENTRIETVVVENDIDQPGTALITELRHALAELPSDQIAGIVALSDGQIHDPSREIALPAPFHGFITGLKNAVDRRIVVKNAPAYAIVGEPVTLTIRISDEGAITSPSSSAAIQVSIDGDTPQEFRLPVGEDVDIRLTLPHGGANIFEFFAEALPQEPVLQNNRALISVNGIRDRLRVLLVSGEPHPGTRTWRNLLKSDSSVDLVHFTILRPPGKQDGVPVDELALIAFPTRELFLEKIDDFDLIIFDRYKRRGILPNSYLENIAQYVEKGGAVLVAAGSDFASANSLYRSPLRRIVPAEPSARVFNEGYTPRVSDIGGRHPVTLGLLQQNESGRWFRQIDVTPTSGHVLMTGIDEAPLLILDRVGEGRVALLSSDHAWLWHRNFEGGGPQLELLRRLAHWMMGEPELEEEMLLTEQLENGEIRIERRTLGNAPSVAEVLSPSGQRSEVAFEPNAEGTAYQAFYQSQEQGLFRVSDQSLEHVFAVGPIMPKEYENPLATEDNLKPLAQQTRGGLFWISDGLPRLRSVAEGRPAAGRGWFAITPRNAYEATDVTTRPLLPVWFAALLIVGFIFLAWLREGGKSQT